MSLLTYTLQSHWEKQGVPNNSQPSKSRVQPRRAWTREVSLVPQHLHTAEKWWTKGRRHPFLFDLWCTVMLCRARAGTGIFPAAARANHSPLLWPEISNLSCACSGIVWGDPEPTPGEADDDLEYKKRWKNSCYPSLSWTAQPQAVWLAPAAEGKVKVWKEVAALGDKGTKQPWSICHLPHLSQFPSGQEQQAHLCRSLLPVGHLLQRFWSSFLTFKISWQTPGMEERWKRWVSLGKAGEPWDYCTEYLSYLTCPYGFPPAFGFAARHKETSHPCLCVEWVFVTAGLGDPVRVGHPSAFLGNYCSRVQPNMLWSIPCAAWHNPVSVTAYFLLFVPSSLVQTQILRLLHQMRCDPLPPDTDWGKLGTKSPLHIRWFCCCCFKLLIYLRLHIFPASPNIWWFYFDCLIIHGQPAFPLTEASFSYEKNEMVDVYFISFP